MLAVSSISTAGILTYFEMPQVSWERIGNIANLIQIFTAVPVLAAVIAWFLKWRRVNRALVTLEKGQGQKPGVLALDFMGGNIRVQVMDFLKRKGFNIDQSLVKEYSRPPSVTPEDAYSYLSELRDQRDRLIADGVTELHLFMRGPIALAVGLGAIFDSTFPVHVYQYAQAPTPDALPYQYWITLHQGSIAGMPQTRVERTLSIAGKMG